MSKNIYRKDVVFSDIINYIKSIYKNDTPILLHAPKFLGNEKKYLSECIDSTYVSYVGKFVTEFENKIKQLTGAKYAAAIVNGTSALHMTLLASGMQEGDEIITQALTFVATAAAIKHAKGEPVFIDVEKETLGMSPEALENFLKKYSITKNGVLYNKMTGKRIFGVIPMHTFGHPVRIEEIQNICYNYGITLIEDAAESLGSFYKGRHTGLWGKAAIISFNGNKPVTTGGGGMVISNDEKIIERVKHLSTTAKVKHPWEFIHDEIGYNMRMPNVNAAIGCAQMEYFDKILENKRETASMYKDFFKQYEDVIFFNEPQNCSSNYWLNVIMFKNKQIRDEFLEYSNSMGVQTRPVWKLIPTLLPYKDCFCDNIAIALELENRIVNIPSGYRE